MKKAHMFLMAIFYANVLHRDLLAHMFFIIILLIDLSLQKYVYKYTAV